MNMSVVMQARQPVVWAVVIAAVGALIMRFAAANSPLIAVGAVGAGCLFAVLIRYPSLGLILTAAVIPLERMGRFTNVEAAATISLMRIVGLLSMGALAVHLLTRKREMVIGLPFILYAVFVSLGMLMTAYSSDARSSFSAAITTVGNLMFFFLVINLATHRRVIQMAMVAWLVVTVIAGLYTVYDWHYGSTQLYGADIGQAAGRLTTSWQDLTESRLGEVRRAMGPTSHAAVYGINLILTLPFFTFFYRRAIDVRLRLLLWFGGSVVVYNILLTNTRAVFILAGIVLFLCVLSGLIRMSIGRLAVGGVVLAVCLAFTPAAVVTRVLDLSNYLLENADSMRIRLAYWEAGWRGFQDHWIAGAGLANSTLVPAYCRVPTPEATSVHNIYLQVAMETGVLGWLLFFSFVGLLMWMGFRSARSFRRRPDMKDAYWFMVACQIAMIAVLINGLQVDVFHFPLKGWWLIAALTYVMDRASRAVVQGNDSVALPSVVA